MKNPAKKGGKPPEFVDYFQQGVGKYVVMHVKKLNGWEDAMDLSDLLCKAVPVTYSAKTSLVQFRWPTTKELAKGETMEHANGVINQAINQFMKRCDRIEFRKKDLEDTKGVTIAAQRVQTIIPGGAYKISPVM